MPSRRQIRDWLATEHHLGEQMAGVWAGELAGLPWRYIRPVVTIAVNSHTSPALALKVAADHSDLPAFVTAAKAQLARLA